MALEKNLYEITNKGLDRLQTLQRGRAGRKRLNSAERRQMALLSTLTFFLGKKNPKPTFNNIESRVGSEIPNASALVAEIGKASGKGYVDIQFRK